MENFPTTGLFGPVGHEILRALTFERASDTALASSSSCSFFSNTAWIQTWDVGKSALPWWTTTVSPPEVIWRMLGKRQSDGIPVVSIFSSGGMDAPTKPWMSSACQFSLSLGSGRFSTRNLASSFRAVFHSVTASLIILIKSFSNSTDSDAIVNGRRISRTPCNGNSARLDSTLRSSMPRKVRTLHALSLRPPDWESDLDTSSKNGPTTSLFGRLFRGKNGRHMKSHRQTEMTCWTPLSLRNSEISVCQIGVESKIGFNLLNSWWTASGLCVHSALIS